MTDRELAQPSAEPEASSPTAAPGFSSRREMREALAAEAATAKRSRVRKVATGARTRDMVRARVKRGGSAVPAGSTGSASSAGSSSSGWRRKASSAGVMTVVFGLFAAVALPAFANAGANVLEKVGPVEAQTLEVTAASADASLFIRDGYSTTSAADLRKLYADALRQQNLAAYLASGARDLGDDYPWPDALSRPQGGGLSPLNYYYRECVDFVAWRLNRDAGATAAPFKWVWSNLAQGSAYSWKRHWEAKGWPVSDVPVAGAVAWFPGGNHVAYVSGVLADGSVALEEYNYDVDHGYSQRVIPASGAIYLYPPG